MSNNAPLSATGAESGVVVQLVPSTAIPSISGGIRTVALIGTGKITKTILSTTVTRGSGSADTLTPAAASLPANITDQNYVGYALGIDYSLISGNVDWGTLAAPAFAQSNVDASLGFTFTALTDSFIVSINGASPLTVTFANNLVTLSAILIAMNAVLGAQAVASSVVVGLATFIKITNSNPAGPVNAVQVLGGTANATLGFVGGIIFKGSRQPALGTKYTLDYESPKLSADYVPAVYYDLQDLINAYGDVNTYSLPLAAQVVFQNSANSGAVIAMQVDPADAPILTGFQNALNKLLAVPNINIVVALTGDSNLYPAILAHITNASAPLEGRFRTAIVGMNGTPSVAAATGFASGFAAGGYGRRILLAYPSSAQVPGTSSILSTDGSMIAAAIAGLRINRNYDVAEPLLRKQLQGIDAIPQNLLRTQKLALRNGGVTVVETVNGIIRIMEDTTTDRSTVDAMNYSVTEIIDFVAETTQNTLNNLFIGIKLLTDTPSMIVTTLNLLLSTYVDLQIINGFTNVSATVNNIDPSQIDIAFDIAPVYPLRYISVKFSI